jgi:thiamine transporter ThiT
MQRQLKLVNILLYNFYKKTNAMKVFAFPKERDHILEGKQLKTPANTTTKKMVLSGLFLALGLLLPFLTGQIPQFGNMLLPMHIPVLICGFICGWPYGLAVGFITPLLRSVLFSMPPMFPTATAMAFELAAYGFATGILYRLLSKKVSSLYVTLLCAMIFGRVIWGIAQMILTGVTGKAFTLAIFLSGAFLNAVPGIVLQIILIPILILALQKAKLMENE